MRRRVWTVLFRLSIVSPTALGAVEVGVTGTLEMVGADVTKFGPSSRIQWVFTPR